MSASSKVSIIRAATLTIGMLVSPRPSVAQVPSSTPHVTGSITGSVRRERTGQPLAGVTVFALHGLVNARTDLAGRYTLDSVAASPDSNTVIIVTARALGLYEEPRGVIVRASGVDTLDFSMRPNGWRERFAIPDSTTRIDSLVQVTSPCFGPRCPGYRLRITRSGEVSLALTGEGTDRHATTR